MPTPTSFNDFLIVRTAIPASISIPYFFSAYIIAVATTSARKAYKFYFHYVLLNLEKAATFMAK